MELTLEKQAAQIRELTRVAHSIQERQEKFTMAGLFKGTQDKPKEASYEYTLKATEVSSSEGMIMDAVSMWLNDQSEKGSGIAPHCEVSSDEENGLIGEAVHYFLDGCVDD